MHIKADDVPLSGMQVKVEAGRVTASMSVERFNRFLNSDQLPSISELAGARETATLWRWAFFGLLGGMLLVLIAAEVVR